MIWHCLMAVAFEGAPDARIIVVSDFEVPSEIARALEAGAKGYISMNAGLDVAIAAIRLVSVGGIYIPTTSVLSSRALAAAASETKTHEHREGLFTHRQLDVIACLRRGESNKLIAYNLGMGECTVKVHIRNVTRKIKARSRTEIAFLTNGLFETSANQRAPI